MNVGDLFVLKGRTGPVFRVVTAENYLDIPVVIGHTLDGKSQTNARVEDVDAIMIEMDTPLGVLMMTASQLAKTCVVVGTRREQDAETAPRYCFKIEDGSLDLVRDR